MENTVNIVTILASCLAIGAIMNKVLIDKSFQISFFSRPISSKPKSSKKLLNIVLNNFYSKFYTRFLGEKIFSFSYFFKCSIISTLSLIIILTYQNYSSSFLELKSYLSEDNSVLFLLALTGGNFIIDYLSIIQTQMFIGFARRSKSLSQSLVAIGSDIIITINGFIYAFSAILFLVLSAFIAISLNPNIEETEITINYKVTKGRLEDIQSKREGISVTAKEIAGYKFIYTAVGVASVGGGENAKETDIFYATVFSNTNFLNPLHFNYTFVDTTGVQAKYYVDNVEINEEKLKEISSGRSDFNYNIEYQTKASVIAIDENLYSKIFLQADSVEDTFWGVGRSDFFTTPVKDILDIKFKYGDMQNKVYCKYVVTGEDPRFVYIPSDVWENLKASASDGDQYGCDEEVLVISGRNYNRKTEGYFWEPSLLKSSIPIVTFFLSTLTSTFLLYIYIFSLFFVRVTLNLLRIIPRRYITILQSQPITLFGGVVGIVLVLVNL